MVYHYNDISNMEDEVTAVMKTVIGGDVIWVLKRRENQEG